MAQTHPMTEARNGNFIFVVGEDRKLTFSVTDSNIADITLNTTFFATGSKDIYLPSNKIETDPLVITFIVSEDYHEWIEFYKWILRMKNSSGDEYQNLWKSCELIALDAQNQPTARWVYTDCYPITLESLQFTLNNDQNQIQTTSSTLRYNRMKVITADGEVIDEDFGKGN